MTACIILCYVNWHICPWISQCGSGQWRRGRVCSWQDEAEQYAAYYARSRYASSSPRARLSQGLGLLMQTAISVPAAAVVGAGMRSADIPAGHSCSPASTPPARSATGPRRSPAGLIHRFSGSVCAHRGQGPQRKMWKGSGMNGSLKLPFISFRD